MAVFVDGLEVGAGSGGSSSLTVGSTAISGGTTGTNLSDVAGVLQETRDTLDTINYGANNIPATANTQLGLQLTGGAANQSAIMPWAGEVVGMGGDMQGDIASGTADFQVGIATGAATSPTWATAAGSVMQVTSAAPRFKQQTLATPVPFLKGDRIQARVVSAALSPTTLDAALTITVRKTGVD